MATPRLVADINPGIDSSYPYELTAVGDSLFFSASDGSSGYELWKSDGTAAGTVLVADISRGPTGSYPSEITGVGNSLFFSAIGAGGFDLGPADQELWKSDGTEEGTVLVADINQDVGYGAYGSNPRELTLVGDTLFFSATGSGNSFSSELWKSDGTEEGTVLVADINPESGSSPRNLIAVGETLFFTANDGSSGSELWKSDGTEAGTVRVADINPGESSSFPLAVTAVGDTLFFSAEDGSSGDELWKSDGTEAGTVRVADINPGESSSFPLAVTAVGDTLFFSAEDGSSGRELWKSDGTAEGTVLVADIIPGPGSSFPTDLVAVGDTLFFTANDGSSGTELWKSDGTAEGTVRVADINPGPNGSFPDDLVAVGDTLFFTANDGSSGSELWKSDGTEEGTVRVADINQGLFDSNPSYLTVVGETLFFSADDGTNGEELWALDLAQNLPELAIARGRARKTEGNSGKTIFSFNVTRTGDLSSESSAAWAVSGSGNNPADADDFINAVLPSGTIRFRAGQSTRTIKVNVSADLVQEFNERFTVTLTNPTGATITTAKATGVIRNDDLIGTPDNDTIIGSRRAEFINGLAGQDDLTGRSGPDQFGFRFGQSRISTPDRITDFRFGQDSISLVNRRDQFRPVPQEFSRAADNNTANTFKELAKAVFADADGLTEGNQALAANSAALVQSTNANIAGTYLMINDGKERLSLRKDLLIDITGFSGPLPDLGEQPVDLVFS